VPLQHDAVQEKVVCNKYANLTFIRNGRLKQVGGARQPWLRGSFAMMRNQYERGDRDHEEEGEKWRQREKWLGLMAIYPY
jgi:Tfp pilus tip-associated adhesin PilY1